MGAANHLCLAAGELIWLVSCPMPRRHRGHLPASVSCMASSALWTSSANACVLAAEELTSLYHDPCTGVIAGIVSFCLLHAFEYVLDLLSARTNGAFGSTTPSIQPDHSINPKDSAHNGVAGPGPNGKAAVADEEVRALRPSPCHQVSSLSCGSPAACMCHPSCDLLRFSTHASPAHTSEEQTLCRNGSPTACSTMEVEDTSRASLHHAHLPQGHCSKFMRLQLQVHAESAVMADEGQCCAGW